MLDLKRKCQDKHRVEQIESAVEDDFLLQALRPTGGGAEFSHLLFIVASDESKTATTTYAHPRCGRSAEDGSSRGPLKSLRLGFRWHCWAAILWRANYMGCGL